MILLGHCGNREFVRDHTLINLILGIYSRFVEETLRLDNQKFNAAFAQNLVPRAVTSSMVVPGQSSTAGDGTFTTAFTENSSSSQTQLSTADALVNALRGAQR